MISRITYSLLLMIISLTSCSQPKIDCSAVLDKKIDNDVNVITETIKICGGFSGDDTLLLQGTILGTQIVSLTNNKPPTYKDIITKLNEIIHSENYPMILLALKAERNSPAKPLASQPNTISFRKMTDYNTAINEANSIAKPLFLYFNSKYSMSSRQMEKGLLADNDVKELLEKYVRYVADADNEEVQTFQTKKFNSNAQPYFVIVINDKIIADFTGSTDDKIEFIDFLDKGLK